MFSASISPAPPADTRLRAGFGEAARDVDRVAHHRLAPDHAVDLPGRQAVRTDCRRHPGRRGRVRHCGTVDVPVLATTTALTAMAARAARPPPPCLANSHALPSPSLGGGRRLTDRTGKPQQRRAPRVEMSRLPSMLARNGERVHRGSGMSGAAPFGAVPERDAFTGRRRDTRRGSEQGRLHDLVQVHGGGREPLVSEVARAVRGPPRKTPGP